MKKVGCLIFMCALAIITVIGCTAKDNEKVAERFINKLVSTQTYKDIKSDGVESVGAYEDIFGKYFTDKCYSKFIANRVPIFYYTVITDNKITKTADIVIEQIKETKNDDYTHYEYTVSYKLVGDNTSIDMKDYFSFSIKGNKIQLLGALDKRNSILKEFKTIAN